MVQIYLLSKANFCKNNTFSITFDHAELFFSPHTATIGPKHLTMKNIAIFASGSGTNAENIINHFSGSSVGRVALLLSDNPEAFALQRAHNHGIKSVVVPRSDFRSGGAQAIELLNDHRIDYIVLAGFLSLVPAAIIEAYRGRIINIHPALLPKYGGKGMYGDRVHNAVIENHECESGITIHHVNEVYDSGSTIAQYKVAVGQDDTPQTLAAKIHQLEYRYFPEVIEREVAGLPEI